MRLPFLLSLLAVTHDAQDVDEEVEDVQVEVDGAEDVLVCAELVHEQLSVDDDKGAEEEGATHAQEHLHARVEREEELDEAEHDEEVEDAEERRVQRREVVLGLERESSEAKEQAGGDHHGLDHRGHGEHRHGEADRDGEQQRHGSEESHVERVPVPHHAKGKDHNDGGDRGDLEHPGAV